MLDVPVKDVISMDRRMAAGDTSLEEGMPGGPGPCQLEPDPVTGGSFYCVRVAQPGDRSGARAKTTSGARGRCFMRSPLRGRSGR